MYVVFVYDDADALYVDCPRAQFLYSMLNDVERNKDPKEKRDTRDGYRTGEETQETENKTEQGRETRWDWGSKDRSMEVKKKKMLKMDAEIKSIK